MPYKQPKIKSPQNWRKRSIRQISKRHYGNGGATLKKIIDRFWSKGAWSRLIIAGTVLFLLAVATGAMAVAWFSKDLPEPGGVIQRDIPLSTKIYDRTGEHLLFEFFSEEKRTPVKLKDLPNYVKWATIVTEDRSFYSHHGFDIKGFIRAVALNLIGRGRPGGSTITQQLIKNALLSPEKTLTRKIKELVLAWQIEKKFTKDEILELYLNEIPYGSVTYGLESAAQAFFGKSAKNLTIAEASALAALPQAPSRYSPYGPNKEDLLGRQKFIINNLASQGYITSQEKEAALAEELKFKEFDSSITAPHFVFYVKELLSEKYGGYAVDRGGLKVITTLDLFKQDIAQKIVTERGEANAKNFNANNAALVAMDPKTGEILSMIGSRDFFNKEIDGEVNVALRPRQPGSSFKPLVYAAAFAAGLSPETILFDLETTFKTEVGDYQPKNYDLKEHGPVTIRQALGSSLNIPAVKTIYLIGVNKVLDLAEKFGYTTLSDRSRFGLALVLGGAEVKLLEHVAAYGALARDGLYHKPVAILRVEDKDGHILEEFKPQDLKDQQVLDSQIVRQINSILTDNNARLLTFQPNNSLHFADRPVAAKTGTTNDFRDAWTIGYTPSLVTGVWVGNNDNSVMKGKAAAGTLAAPIWRDFMSQVLGNTPVEGFKTPEEVSLPPKPMLNGNYYFESLVKIDKTTGNLATDFTPQKNIIEKTFRQVHNILHYVRRQNILGPIPADPWSDPNYTSWELPVENWTKIQEIIIDQPPSVFDDFHKPADQPNIKINNPASENLSDHNLSVSVSGSAPRGIRRLEYYLDNNLIGEENINGDREINNLVKNLTLPNIFSNGEHLLKVVIYDDLDNDADDAVSINLQAENNPIKANTLEFSKPANQEKISRSSFPYQVSLNVKSPEKIKKIDLYWMSRADNSSLFVTSITDIKEQVDFILQQAPPVGYYTLYTIVQDQSGSLQLDVNVAVELK